MCEVTINQTMQPDIDAGWRLWQLPESHEYQHGECPHCGRLVKPYNEVVGESSKVVAFACICNTWFFQEVAPMMASAEYKWRFVSAERLTHDEIDAQIETLTHDVAEIQREVALVGDEIQEVVARVNFCLSLAGQ